MSNRSNSGSDQSGLKITTLFIKPWAGKLRRYEILSHFSAFGDVRNVRICNETKCSYEFINNERIYSETKHSYGFVKFIQPESATKALGVDFHMIGGRRVDVAVADDCYQDFTTLLHLNDDCILEILSMKCLNVGDWCSVAEACPRLKEIASRVFRREHQKCNIRSLSDYESEPAERILMNFGSEICHLDINVITFCTEKWVRKVLKSMADYCSTTLQSLNLCKLEILEDFTAELGPLFKNLQKLKMTKCIFGGASKDWFADCGSMVELDIRDNEYQNVNKDGSAFIIGKTFPKLQRFVWDSYSRPDLSSLESFISRHMNLKSLKIKRFRLESSVLQVIANCSRLETLKCCIGRNSTLDLSNLGHLRDLEINCDDQNVTETALGLENLKFLENLSIHFAVIDSEFVQALSQLKRLQALKFSSCNRHRNLNLIGDLAQLTTLEIGFDRDGLVDLDIVLLVERLSKLNCLTLTLSPFEMNLELYLRVLDVVRRNSDRSKLTVRLGRSGFSNDDLLADFALNAHLVEIIIH